MSTRANDIRARLTEARDHLAAALEAIDEAAPHVPEPERSTLTGVLGARHDVARLIRQLDNIATLTGAGTGAKA